jgi:AraC-like DNA-binding protein
MCRTGGSRYNQGIAGAGGRTPASVGFSMFYGDEYCVEVPLSFDPERTSVEELGRLFQDAWPLTRFQSAADGSFFHEQTRSGFLSRSLCYRVDADALIEINDSFLRTPVVIRNEVADLISFQFVSSVKRAEFLGEYRNLHNLGPAIIVSAIPGPETTYRAPRINENIRHVVVHATLSNLLQRMNESPEDYPGWFREILEGKHRKPRQRVLFLHDVQRDLTWSCFHLPVAGNLLGNWMAAKYRELLCVGLQLLKHDQPVLEQQPARPTLVRGDKIRRARAILNREYADPPSLEELAQRLGMSGTQLKSSFRSVMGTTVLQYCILKRIEAARLLLDENRHSISDIANIVGYHDHSAFSRAFRRLSGCTPHQWRHKNTV